MRWFTQWRRGRVLRRARLDAALWHSALERYSFTRALSEEERARLRELAILFLHEKAIVGAGGLAVRDEIRVRIAAQACMLILNLGLDYYRGWVEVIVYPGEFLAEYEYVDEHGIAHRVAEPMSGESWPGGPVILSWADAEESGEGYNVVLHEFAHKLDMLNGEANGFPPLHPGMDRAAWTRAFSAAYEDFCARIERGEHTEIDPYGAQNPGEFFAVLSEAFFETPQAVLAAYGEVYRQLAAFYRQDPASRLRGRIER
ncbi:MAG TPA: M90 family metallopeptidase [Burkholderiales bacterium]|nr:M90 family metallopeptidase [Burkholderiales bacterium]